VSDPLPDVSALDLSTTATCGAVMHLITVAAVCIPATPACRVDPLIVLREQ
jgi:hypothetical protein